LLNHISKEERYVTLKGRIVILEPEPETYFTDTAAVLRGEIHADVILKEHASMAFMIQILKKMTLQNLILFL
jgi:hypothetical protein